MSNKVGFYLFSLPFVISLVYLGFVPKQSEFLSIILPYIFAFFFYYLLVFREVVNYNFKMLLGLAIFVRIVLIFAFPNLSDDIYRFIWDGRCIHLGLSPFESLPSEIVDKYTGLNEGLFSLLNSPSYYSIYPPIGQMVSYVATLPFLESYFTSSLVFKLFILIADLGTIYLGTKILDHLKLPSLTIFIYALNPLIIIELSNNLHFEVFMIHFMMASLYFLLIKRTIWSGIALGLAICSKLLPLMFIPLFLMYLSNIKKCIKWLLAVGITSIISFSPFINFDILHNLENSIGLYVNKFEFNASIYYLLRAIGYWIKGFNTIHIIGPFLSVATVVIISIQALIFKKKYKPESFIFFLLVGFCTYLFLATIIHPWYLSLPIILCVFTPYRFPIVWSGLIFLTYSNYAGGIYFERWWVIGIEYFVLILYIIWEASQFKTENLRC